MKKCVLMSIIAGMAVSVHADMFWFNGSVISNQLGVALAADMTDYNIGCFAQLIFAGVRNSDGDGGRADAFDPVNSLTGVSGDDMVVATMFAGENDNLHLPGYFPAQVNAAVTGDPDPTDEGYSWYYYVRVFNQANPNFLMGTNAPVPGPSGYYWQSTLHQYVYNRDQPIVDNYNFTGSTGRKTTIYYAIPEPGALGLGIVGLLSLRLFARKRK